MSAFLVSVLILLGMLAPEQHLLVSRYLIVEETRPLYPGGATAWATLRDERIHIVTEAYKGVYAEERLNRVWTACTLAHESTHLLTHSGEEWPALAWQYMCLDTLEAPKWMKEYVRDRVYSLLREKITDRTEEGVHNDE